MEFEKALGKDNPADLYTKNLDCKTMDKHVTALNGEYVEGRAAMAPELHTLSRAWSPHLHNRYWELTNWVQIIETEVQKWMTKMRRADGRQRRMPNTGTDVAENFWQCTQSTVEHKWRKPNDRVATQR